jgi:hypothetical protein
MYLDGEGEGVIHSSLTLSPSPSSYNPFMNGAEAEWTLILSVSPATS